MNEKNQMVVCVLIVIVSVFIGAYFHNPYPCSNSGIGCSSIWESLADNWSSYVCVIGFVLAGGWLFCLLFCEDDEEVIE